MKKRTLLQVIIAFSLAFTLRPSICFGWMYHNLGLSMEPTIKQGKYFWSSNYSNGSKPARGDIIVFKYKTENSTVLVKRIIGLPKEKVIIRKGIVYIMDQPTSQEEKLNEPYLAPGIITEPDGEFSIPDGQYFVLGDNRGASRDSRKIGCIPRKDVIGKMIKIF